MFKFPEHREKMRFFLSIFSFLLLQTALWAKPCLTLSGRVQDKSTSQRLASVAVYVVETGSGTTTDLDGRYSLCLPEGSYTLKLSYIGYTSLERQVKITAARQENFYMEPDAVLLEGVEIKGSRANRVAQTTLGMASFSSQMVQRIPALLGEADIIKAVQMLPGVLMASESSSGFSVRGGGLDQNAILLDKALIYNPSHTCGFFSVFNNDVLGGAEVYKGDMPISYGGRLSSVVDVSMRDGNFNDYHLDAGIGLLLAKATVDGPIWKDRTSFLVSGRATYFDFFLPLFDMKGTKLGFYDLNARVVHKFNQNKDKIALSGYMGQDRFGLSRGDETTNAGLNYGNKMLGLTHTHFFSNRLVINSNLHATDYVSAAGQDATGYDFVWKTRITDYSAQTDVLFTPTNHDVRFGAIVKYHTYQPGELDVHMRESLGFIDTSRDLVFNQDKLHTLESAMYAGNSQTIGKRLMIKYGLRLSTFSNIGPDSVSYFDQDYKRTERRYFGTKDVYHTRVGFEPRAGISYLFDHEVSLKFSYARTVQYSQLATNSNAGNPMDVWFPANVFVRPQTADMLALGVSIPWQKADMEFSVEGYYKWMNHVIDFKDNSNLLLNGDLYGELRMGRGWAYGVEVYVQRKKGLVNGSLSYTFSRSLRVIDQVNNGKAYPSPQDRPHALNLLLNIDPHPRHAVSLNWVFYSGQPATYPIGKAVIDGSFVPVYGERNADRMPDYHRLDLSYTLHSKPNTGKRFSWNLSVGVYNAYARKNPWSITFRQDENNPNIAYAEKIYLFSAVPFISYNLKF